MIVLRFHGAMNVDANLLKAARVLLGWSQQDLSDNSGVGRSTIIKLEAGEGGFHLSTVESVLSALEKAGVVFLPETNTEGPGLRLSKGDSRRPRVIRLRR